MARTSAKVAARERARAVRSRNAVAAKERARQIEHLQVEFFEAVALREEAAKVVEIHELDAAKRVAELLELGLSADDVAALLDTDVKVVRGLRNRVNAAVRMAIGARVSTAPDVPEVVAPHGRVPDDVGEVIGVAASDSEIAATVPRAAGMTAQDTPRSRVAG